VNPSIGFSIPPYRLLFRRRIRINRVPAHGDRPRPPPPSLLLVVSRRDKPPPPPTDTAAVAVELTRSTTSLRITSNARQRIAGAHVPTALAVPVAQSNLGTGRVATLGGRPTHGRRRAQSFTVFDRCAPMCAPV